MASCLAGVCRLQPLRDPVDEAADAKSLRPDQLIVCKVQCPGSVVVESGVSMFWDFSESLKTEATSVVCRRLDMHICLRTGE